MNRGAWHQCGDRSQKLVVEQLEAGRGVGVILSPRDLTHSKAIEYAAQYADLQAQVLIDPQFYVPDFSNDNLDTYGLSQFRTNLATLWQVTDDQMAALTTELATLGNELGVSGVIAPAAMYEAGRPDIVELNGRLFAAAKNAGDALGVPTLASVTLARSVTRSDSTVAAAVDAATALNADGWYYAFEFEEERLPSSREAVRRCCDAGLSLALTGRPLLPRVRRTDGSALVRIRSYSSWHRPQPEPLEIHAAAVGNPGRRARRRRRCTTPLFLEDVVGNRRVPRRDSSHEYGHPNAGIDRHIVLRCSHGDSADRVAAMGGRQAFGVCSGRDICRTCCAPDCTSERICCDATIS